MGRCLKQVHGENMCTSRRVTALCPERVAVELPSRLLVEPAALFTTPKLVLATLKQVAEGFYLFGAGKAM